ncbi:MAG TPA: hypothetical protein VF647_00090 [Longimicrobium sp.]|jgi:hypothetical protein
MKSVKLGACFAAAAITLTSSVFLAAPAAASAPAATCSVDQLTYAAGYANGYCQANGYSGGQVTSCSSDDQGNFTANFTCTP